MQDRPIDETRWLPGWDPNDPDHIPVDPATWEPRGNPSYPEPPLGWRHPVTGRRNYEPEPRLLRLGTYFRRARYMACRSQQSLSDETGVTQSVISRFERALAPSMDVEKLLWLSEAIAPRFPLGFCPHEHVCLWQPIELKERKPPLAMAIPGLDYDGLSAAIDARAGLGGASRTEEPPDAE
jgi:transcriptional regulator with XRE-family HTH domain